MHQPGEGIMPSVQQRSSRPTTPIPREFPEQTLAQPNDFHVELTLGQFTLCWWLTALYRGCTGAFLIATAWLYHWVLLDDHPVYEVNHLVLTFPLKTMMWIEWFFAGTGLFICSELCKRIYCSIRAGELVFSCDVSLDPRTESAAQAELQAGSTMRRMYLRATRWCRSFRQKRIEPVVSIHGAYYESFFLLLEYIQVACQLYQTYQMSWYIATRWANNVFVAMVIVNCFSTPIIHRRVSPTNLPLRRLWKVVVNGALNFVNILLLPLIIMSPYVRVFDTNPDTFGFPFELILDDVWYARAVRENQQLFVTSYIDLIATMIPFWSIWSCIRTCEGLVHCTKLTVVVPISSEPESSRDTPRRLTRSNSYLRKREWFLFYYVLCSVGIGTLCFQIIAQTSSSIPGCMLQPRPWFTEKPSCVIMNVNCYRRNIQGNQHEITAVLEPITPKSVFQLIFSHCPQLQIPPIIRNFHHLAGLDFYNCTLNQWQSEASLQQESHPELKYVYVVRSNMSAIPDGLIPVSFPKKLDLIYFLKTNLTTLPDDLHEKWRVPSRLGFDYCQFDRFPSTLTKMPLKYIWMDGNPMTSIDPGIQFTQSLEVLSLSNTSLTSLPTRRMSLGDDLRWLMFEFSQLTSVPLYVREWFEAADETVRHSLYGSPFCSVEFSDAQQPDHEAWRRYQTQVCSTNYETARGFVNIEDIALRRPI